MYALLKSSLLYLLQVPSGPPEPPNGDAAHALVFRAAPAFLRYRVLMLFLRTVPSLFISLMFFGQFVAGFDSELPIARGFVWVVVFAVFGLSVLMRYLLVRLDYDLRYYIVTDRSLRIRQGAWRVEEATFTFANIQNLTVHQGPVERLLGIANVQIETAGGGGPVDKQAQLAFSHRGVLAGISDAYAVRDRIQRLLKQYRDAGLGDERHGEADPRRAVAPVAGSAGGAPGLSPLAMVRLRQVRDELRRLELSFSGTPGAGAGPSA
ncbi:MAG: PH domain-containing protein [Polyangiales bacterium]|nr:PH domain-containing protein [Myxococcales bacterium]